MIAETMAGTIAETRVVPIRFQLGERSLWTARRRLRRVGHGLRDLLDEREMRLPPLADANGFDLRSLPVETLAMVDDGALLTLVRQRYPRHFIRLDGGWPAYWQGFSAKTRSTLKRKRARWVDAAGGLDVRSYATSDEMTTFARLAGALSSRTYQERLLGAGLPTGAAALADMQRRATAGEVRAFLLFYRGEPAAYLYLPSEAGVVIYAHLGYDPDLAPWSPGTVLQLEALERLFAEPGLALFDFTEGDGAHKRLFGREAVACADVLALRRTWRNQLLLASLRAFDTAVVRAAGLSEARGWKPYLKRLFRR